MRNPLLTIYQNPKADAHWEPKREEAPDVGVYGTTPNGVPFYIVPKSELPKGMSYQKKYGEGARPESKPDRTVHFRVRHRDMLQNGQTYNPAWGE